MRDERKSGRSSRERWASLPRNSHLNGFSITTLQEQMNSSTFALRSPIERKLVRFSRFFDKMLNQDSM